MRRITTLLGATANSSDRCYLFDHSAGRYMTSLVYRLPTVVQMIQSELSHMAGAV